MKMTFGKQELIYNEINYAPSKESTGKGKLYYNEINYSTTKESSDTRVNLTLQR